MEKFTPISELDLDTNPEKALSLSDLPANVIGNLKTGGRTAWQDFFDRLSARTRHGLDRLGIDSFESFRALTHEEFMSVRALGKTSWKEVSRHQKELKKSLHEKSSKGPLRESNLSLLDGQNMPEWQDFFDRLSARTRHGLDRLGIDSFESFLALTHEEFMSIRALGKTSWKEVSRHQKKLCERCSSPPSNICELKSHNLRASDKELLAFIREELRNRGHILDDLGIHTFDRLLTLRFEDVTAIEHVGIIAWKKLQQAIQKVSSFYGNEITMSPQEVTLDHFPLFGGIGIGATPIPDSFFPEEPTESLSLSPRNRSIVEKIVLSQRQMGHLG